MNLVRPKLYLGDLTDTHRERIKENGITAILSCVMSDERCFIYPTFEGFTLKRCFIPINDGEPYPFPLLTKALEQLDLWLQDGETVLVHCAAGISRSATTVIAHLMGYGMSWDEAERIVRDARPVILPHPELKISVLKYYKSFPYDGSLGDPV